MTKKKKTPRDLNKLASFITDQATSEDSSKEDAPTTEEKSQKNPAAVELGRLGGLKGGRARAKKLTEEQRKEIARNAARARWKKSKD